MSRLSFATTGEAGQTRELTLAPVSGLSLQDGFQDPRAFRSGNTLYALASRLYNADSLDPIWTQYLIEFDEKGESAVSTTPIQYGQEPRPEKNWMPVAESNSMPVQVVRQVSPTSTLHLSKDGGFTENSHVGPSELNDARGGTPLVAVGETWVALVHHTYTKPLRYYSHRIIEFRAEDEDLVVARFSPEFFLLGAARLEFATGLFVDEENAFIYLGSEEKDSIVIHCKLGDLLDLLSFEFSPG